MFFFQHNWDFTDSSVFQQYTIFYTLNFWGVEGVFMREKRQVGVRL